MKDIISKMNFDGIKIYYNDGTIINDRVQVKISYLTALLYIDGENVCTFYPKSCDKEMIESIVNSYCKDYEIDLSQNELEAIAEFTINKMPK